MIPVFSVIKYLCGFVEDSQELVENSLGSIGMALFINSNTDNQEQCKQDLETGWALYEVYGAHIAISWICSPWMFFPYDKMREAYRRLLEAYDRICGELRSCKESEFNFIYGHDRTH